MGPSFWSFLGETDGPFLGADLLGRVPGAQRGQGGSAPQAWMPYAAEHPARLEPRDEDPTAHISGTASAFVKRP